MSEILVPIFVCVVLPVSIVAIVFAATINSDNKRSKVLIKAIECCGIDADQLAAAFQKSKKDPLEVLNLRLLRGCMFSFVGVVLFIVGIVSLCSGSEFSSESVVLPLIFGGVSFAIGLSYLTVYFVSRRQIKD
ncbi:MAG: hypothetical protein K2M31_06470 [Muribaculaceae bacterium]|nr:hypothetical protein [Muribaculaceae bacterium]